MITVFAHSFSLFGFVGAIILVLILISQTSWWIFGKYFPSTRLCMLVHKNSGTWFRKERKILAGLEVVTVFGFLTTVLLLGIIPLNVTILAQVFELFVPPGDRLILPFIGSYATFPLLVGLLFATVEVAFSALMEYRRNKEEKTWPIAIVIGMMIVVEAGLNFYRSWIIEFDQTIYQTFWDKFIGFGGPVLSAFIGVVVPLAMVLLGAYAMLEFIMPAIKNTAIAVRFIFSNLIVGLVIILFGFHNKRPIILPGAVSRLHHEFKKTEDMSLKLDLPLKKLKKIFPEIKKHEPQKIESIEKGVGDFDIKIGELDRWLESGYKDKIAEENQKALVVNKKILRNTISRTKKMIREFYAEIEMNEQNFEDLSEQTIQAKKDLKIMKEKKEEYQKAYEETEERQTTLENYIQTTKIFEFCRELQSALNGSLSSSQFLSNYEIEELAQLTEPPISFSKNDKDWNKIIADASKSIVNQVHTKLVEISKKANDAREWLQSHKLQVEYAQHKIKEDYVQTYERMLSDLDSRMQNKLKAMNDRFDETQAQLREVALQTRAVLMWMGLLLPLRKSI